MPNDAKVGLVVGLGVVLAVAFIFFRQEAFSSTKRGESHAAAAVQPTHSVPRDKVPANPVSLKRE